MQQIQAGSLKPHAWVLTNCTHCVQCGWTNKQTRIKTQINKPMKPMFVGQRSTADQIRDQKWQGGSWASFSAVCAATAGAPGSGSHQKKWLGWAAAMPAKGDPGDAWRMEEKVEKRRQGKGGRGAWGKKRDKNECKEQNEQCKRGQIKGARRGARQKIHFARKEPFLSVRGKWYLCKIQFQMSREEW